LCVIWFSPPILVNDKQIITGQSTNYDERKHELLLARARNGVTLPYLPVSGGDVAGVSWYFDTFFVLNKFFNILLLLLCASITNKF
jgi:hypothetical protein